MHDTGTAGSFAAPLPHSGVQVRPASTVRQTLSCAKPISETVTRLVSPGSIAIRDTQRSGRPGAPLSTLVQVGAAASASVEYQTWPLLCPTHTTFELPFATATVEMLHGGLSLKCALGHDSAGLTAA